MEDIRRRRVNELGEWDYECSSCLLWLDKSKFKGCVEKIDAYGNCLMCRSCISQRANKKKMSAEQKEVREIFIRMGYNPDSDVPIYKQVEERYKLKYG
jgi:hypothetical protein